MIYQGIVRNGVIVLENGVLLPEGTHVRVEPPAQHDSAAGDSVQDDPVFRMDELAVDTGIRDLAANIDHYLYGDG